MKKLSIITFGLLALTFSGNAFAANKGSLVTTYGCPTENSNKSNLIINLNETANDSGKVKPTPQWKLITIGGKANLVNLKNVNLATYNGKDSIFEGYFLCSGTDANGHSFTFQLKDPKPGSCGASRVFGTFTCL